MSRQKRTVVVGSGLSGLCAAYFCHRGGHQVTVFEAQKERGMDTHRLWFPPEDTASGEPSPQQPPRRDHSSSPSDPGAGYLDVPLRVMSEDGWKTLLSLCQHLKVETFPVNAPVSLGWLGGQTWFRSGTLKLGSRSIPILGSPRYANRTSLKIGRNLFRFYQEPLTTPNSPLSLDEFFHQRDYDPVFWRGFILPLLSTITTCRQEKLLQYPARNLLAMVRSIIFGPPLRRLKGGTKALVDRLTEEISFKSGSPVVELAMPNSSSKTSSHSSDENGPITVINGRGEKVLADHVIFATQANHLEFLRPHFPEELSILKNFDFDQGELVVHRDISVMPRHRKDWTPLSYQMSSDYKSSMFSVWVNPIEPSLNKYDPVFQTWNPLVEIDPQKTLSRIPLERAVVSLKTSAHLKKLADLTLRPSSRVFFCGSWAYPGVPLLESAVKSAARIALHLGLTLPMPVESTIMDPAG